MSKVNKYTSKKNKNSRSGYIWSPIPSKAITPVRRHWCWPYVVERGSAMKLLYSLWLVVALGLTACDSKPTEPDPVFKRVTGSVQISVVGIDTSLKIVVLEGATVSIAPHAEPEVMNHVGTFITDSLGETPVFTSNEFALLQLQDGSSQDKGVTVTVSRPGYLDKTKIYFSPEDTIRKQVRLIFDPSNP